jgi:hypothetical protein
MQFSWAGELLDVSHDVGADSSCGQSSPLSVDSEIVDRAAEALHTFVFSGCARLGGKHRWDECEEETKAGFRREAAAVLAAIWPLLARGEH